MPSSCPPRIGYMEVLYGHAPLLAELGAGDVRMHGGQRRRRAKQILTT